MSRVRAEAAESVPEHLGPRMVCIPGGLLKPGLEYVTARWSRLLRFLDHARIPLDNYLIEGSRSSSAGPSDAATTSARARSAAVSRRGASTPSSGARTSTASTARPTCATPRRRCSTATCRSCHTSGPPAADRCAAARRRRSAQDGRGEHVRDFDHCGNLEDPPCER